MLLFFSGTNFSRNLENFYVTEIKVYKKQIIKFKQILV